MTRANQPNRLATTGRRRQKRMPLRFPVCIICGSPTGEVCHDGECVDISEAGVAFVTAADLNVGEIVSLEFCQGTGCLVRLSYRMRRRYGGYFVTTAPALHNTDLDSHDDIEVGWPI